MNKNSDDKKILSSVTNPMSILRLFTLEQSELSLTSIVRQTGIPKSSAHRLTATLEKEGFLSKNPRTGHYRLGLAILTLGGVIYSHRDLYKEGLPIVTKLSKTLNETAHICLMEDEHVVYLFRIESQNPDRLLTQIGRKNPLYCTSEGLCILAYQHEKTINQVLEKELFAYTPFTTTDKQKLKELLSTIRNKGYCVLSHSYYEYYTGIAAPIRDHTGAVVSSLSVVGRSERITPERAEQFARVVCKAAAELSEHLGYID